MSIRFHGPVPEDEVLETCSFASNGDGCDEVLWYLEQDGDDVETVCTAHQAFAKEYWEGRDPTS